MKKYRFPCGCTFDIIQEHADPDVLPYIDFDEDRIPYTCSATWDLLARGITKGVFQLESQLGKTWTKKLQPEHIEDMSALGSLLRPGCLRAIDENTKCSMTELFCRRKNGQLPVEYLHPILSQVLSTTYGVLTYQEQAMKIAQLVAGFDLQSADELRKAIGKKLAEEMAKVKIKFLEGAKIANIVTEDQAKEIFGWIEKSQRYSFNKSHALSYGINGYLSAYAKTHGTVQFYTSWLYYAKDKQDPQQEIKELVNDAKLLDVNVSPPDICNGEAHFSTDGKIVTFGISDVKGIGEAQVGKMEAQIDYVSKLLGKHIQHWSWYELLVHFSGRMSNTFIKGMISVGGFRQFGNNRSLMLNEYEKWESLTAKEQEWIRLRSLTDYAKQLLPTPTDNSSINDMRDILGITNTKEFTQELKEEIHSLPTFTSLTQAINAGAKVKKEGGAASNKNRQAVMESLGKLLENPASPIKDTPTWIAWNEENLLGIALTCNKVDACDISDSNCTCKEFLAGRDGHMIFAVQVDSVRVIVTKKGKSAGSKMAFLTVSDSSCAVEMIAFPQAWEDYSSLLNEGNTVTIQAKRDKKNNSLVIEKVQQI